MFFNTYADTALTFRSQKMSVGVGGGGTKLNKTIVHLNTNGGKKKERKIGERKKKKEQNIHNQIHYIYIK